MAYHMHAASFKLFSIFECEEWCLHICFSVLTADEMCVFGFVSFFPPFFFSFIRKVKNFCVGKQKSIFHFAHEKLDAKCCIWYERKIHTFTLAKRIEHGVSDFSLISKKIVDNNGYNHLGYAQKYASYFHVFFLLSLVFPVPLYFCDFIRNLLEYYAHKDETFLL